MSACDECRNDFDAMSRLVESLPDDMKTSDCVSNAKMLLVALAYQKVEKENAKLRELVRWMYDRMDESCAVQYPYAPAPISYDRLMQAQARARELGEEVDG